MSVSSNGPTSAISLGNCRVSRFIVGHNPPCANSHISAELNKEMAQYFSTENILKLYHHAEESGIKTFLIRGDYRMLNLLELYRRQDGKMNVIGQTASEMHDILVNIRIMAAAGVEAIYHHGTQTDKFWRQGRIDQCLDYLKCMRDQGVSVGLATHIPQVIEYAEEHAWDVDFYMASLYNISRVPRESLIVSGDARPYTKELYLPEDPELMLAAVRATSKPVLAFKILAAGRLCKSQDSVKEAFRRAYSGIKPTDGVIVGLFPKYFDQLSADLDYARQAIDVSSQPDSVPSPQ